MEKFKLDDKVKVIGRNISGKIAFIGETHFSEGEWLGIILDEAKGRNNGSIDGQHYFKCPRNYGLFVRSCQLQKLNVENESELDSKARKITYPNYLENASEKKIKSSYQLKVNNKPPASKIHPMKTVIEDLKDTLKCKSEEIICLEKQKKEAFDKVKGMKSEIHKLFGELKKNVKRENDLKLEIKKIKNEFLLLKRKLYKTEKWLLTSENNRRKLDMTIEGLREITEHAIIEKEIAEEKTEQFELLLKDEVDKRKTIEMELDRIKESVKIQTVNGVPAVHYVSKIENENEIMKCALMKLKDLYENLQNKFINSKTEVKKCTKEIENLKSSEKAMGDALAKCQDETLELYDIIDSISNVDDIVFEVTERNLKAEEIIKDMCEKLHDTENQLHVSEETEQELQEIRLMCRDEIESLESKIRHMQTALNQKSILLQEREATINKYRELTSTLHERNRKLAEDLEDINNDRKEAVVAAENLKLKIQREKRNGTKELIEKEIMKCEFEVYREKIDYYRLFMPDNFFEEGGENSAIQTKLIATKMLKKLNLLSDLLQSTSYDITKSEELKDLVIDTKLLTYVYELQASISLFMKSSDRISSEQFVTLGKYHETLEQQSKIIDSFLNSLANSDSNRNFCVTLKNVSCCLTQLLNTEYATYEENTITNISCYLNMIQINCNCLFTYCKAFVNNENNSEEFKSDVNLMKGKIATIKINVKSVLNIIKNCENERIFLNQTVEERAKKNWLTVQEIINYVLIKYAALTDDEEFDINDLNNKEKISLNEIIHKCLAVDEDLRELREKLSNGDYFIESVPDATISDIYNYAQCRKQEKEDMINMMRSQISTSDSKIVNLEGSLLVAQNKINKIQNIVKKDESQQTDNREYFINQFSEKIDNFSILNDMENTIKYLKQKNFELMSASVKHHHEILSPLKMLQKPKYRHDTHDIFILQKRLNEIAVKVKKIILPQIPDITRKTKSSKVVKYRRYLTQKILIKREIEDELKNITVHIKNLKDSSHTIFGGIPSIHLQKCDFH